MHTQNTFILIALISIIEFFGDSFKMFSKNGNPGNLTLGFVFYFVMILFLIKAFSGANLIYVNTVWDALSTLISAILAILLLGEIPSTNELIGMGLIISGIIFMGQTN